MAKVRFNIGHVTGLSAYEVAVKNGYTGTESDWAELLSGVFYMSDILAGKKIVCFGDSLMCGKDAIKNLNYDSTYGWMGGYPQIIRDKHPKAIVYNYGKDGATISKQGTAMAKLATTDSTLYTNIVDYMTETLNALTFTPDYVILSGGGNDLNYAAGSGGLYPVASVMGDITSPYSYDEPNDNTVIGAIETALRLVYNKFPACKILFIGFPCSNFGILNTEGIPNKELWNTATLKSLADKISYTCNKYGATFLDLNNSALAGTGCISTQSSLNPYFYSDLIHITNEGYNAIANLVDYALITGNSNHSFDMNNFKIHQTSGTATIYPNIMNIWDDTSINAYNITLGTDSTDIAAYEYRLRIKTGSEDVEFNVTPTPKFAGVTLVDGDTLGLKANCTYEISILDGLAVFREFEN